MVENKTMKTQMEVQSGLLRSVKESYRQEMTFELALKRRGIYKVNTKG